MNNLFIFLGPSASGKTTLEDKFLKLGLDRFVSDTTRSIREGEVDGINYNFISVEEFKQKTYAMTIKITDTWYYGASEEALIKASEKQNDTIYSIINIEPSANLKKFIEDNNIPLNVYIIFFDIDKETRIKLMKARGETEEDIQKRLEREETLDDFKKFNIFPDLIIKDLYTSFEVVKDFIDQKKKESIKQSIKLVNEKDFSFKEESKEVDEVIDSLEKEAIWK